MRTLLFFFLITLPITLLAQEKDKPDPTVDYAIPDSSDHFHDELPVLNNGPETYHESFAKVEVTELSAKDSKDTTSSFSKDTSSRVSEDVQRVMSDSLYWKGVDECFALFDSMNVDPYNKDTTYFKDTVAKFLCTSKFGRDADWCFPIRKDTTHVTSGFGQRRYKWHYGTDLKLEVGDTLQAIFDGVVRIAKYNPRGYGYYVMVRHHNGLESLYGHMSRIDVHVGQQVKAGEMIGLGGNTGRSTGSHLHFEVRFKGKAIDPATFYDFGFRCLNSCDFEITPKDFDYYREMSKSVYHRIRSGDYLGRIARRYNTSISKICRLNNISRNTILRIGRRLRVR